ncbi:LAMI_0G15060g1_1 [Lachancea mirantina]|uniref:LAMI_0G15060g1_1 n=1 Tax=Lachancea mirantina TaxID=1230905 RepID=A0A1G4KCC5_9SACH|nr:LAMI_0G15060g1_1 [Lachancea mirantina]
MTSTELNPLARTLTDVLDEELYHHRFAADNGGVETAVSNSTPKTWKNRSLEDLLMLPEQSFNGMTLTEANDAGSQQIFSKYADPSLTTMSLEKPVLATNGGAAHAGGVTPQQATVSLNAVMSVNPFLTRLPSHPQDVRISAPSLFQGDDMLDLEDAFSPEYYYDDSQKVFSWPLQESTTTSQDAMSIFDREFTDDLSDDEDDDDEDGDEDVEGSQFMNEWRQVTPIERSSSETPLAYPAVKDEESHIFGERRPPSSFVDDDRHDVALLDDDDDDDSDSHSSEEDEDEESFDEDMIYQGKLRKSSVIDSSDFTAPSSTRVTRESTPDGAGILSSHRGLEAKMDHTSSPSVASIARRRKHSSRRKSSCSVVPAPSIKKKLTSLVASSPGGAALASTPGHGQDVHTCQLINPLTNQPCLKKFSRPYDLIRHQKTIHASKKKVFRCLICIQEQGEEGYQKTFSRGDALSRHVKVKHELTGAEAQKAIQFAKEHVEFAAS